MPQSTCEYRNEQFDVFLAHNSADKLIVHRLAMALKERGLRPWLDIEQIPPGRWFQDIIQQAIPHVRSVAVIIGSHGLGKWQMLELRAFVSNCVEQSVPVIPVLLPGVLRVPSHLSFLAELRWVRFDQSLEEPHALHDLVWGITGQRPPYDPRGFHQCFGSDHGSRFTPQRSKPT